MCLPISQKVSARDHICLLAHSSKVSVKNIKKFPPPLQAEYEGLCSALRSKRKPLHLELFLGAPLGSQVLACVYCSQSRRETPALRATLETPEQALMTRRAPSFQLPRSYRVMQQQLRASSIRRWSGPFDWSAFKNWKNHTIVVDERLCWYFFPGLEDVSSYIMYSRNGNVRKNEI